MRQEGNKGIVYALLAAALFGISTPFAKTLLAQIAPVMLASLLYFGSGLGLLLLFITRKLIFRSDYDALTHLRGKDLLWLGGAILAGGIAGPVLLMIGLTLTSASSASLLLNMEGVFTAMLAWFVFKENFDQRIFIGMLFIVAAGILLSWEQVPTLSVPWGALAITAACLSWGIDNNLTRKISASDAVQIAGIKGFVAGSVNLLIALILSFPMPDIKIMLVTAAIGFCGYGLSLVLFVLALRHLGTARTGAYFSIAPFVGAVISLTMLGENPGWIFWLAAVLMAGGIWLHLSENHTHEHSHDPMLHTHTHYHDIHHQHKHDFPWDGKEPHSHPHQHEALTHTHPHFPNIDHRHQH